MYIIFNPSLPIYNRLILQLFFFIVFILALLIPYRLINKEIPNILKFMICFIPLVIITLFLNINNELNSIFKDKSHFITLFEIVYAVLIVKFGYKIKWKDSFIIGFSSIVFIVFIAPVATIFENILFH
jgi:peptidoglycan/LPS O-acetylase OafA/YrhL